MNIAVINTGGTISCIGSPLAPMPAQAFAAACTSFLNPILAQQFPDTAISYINDLTFLGSSSGTLDSTNVQPSDWCLLASLAHYDAYDGWVVLHGTDSMAYTGTALPFLLSVFDAKGTGTAVLSKPIILTGSQVPMFHQASSGAELSLNFNTDAFRNVCGAMAAAQTGIPEVCVYFDSLLFRGCRVVKTSASRFAAFSSPNYPPLGEYGLTFAIESAHILPPPINDDVSLDNPLVLAAATAQLNTIATAINSVPVVQLSAFPAQYDTANGTALLADLINACLGQNVRGLILQAYGGGNFPSGNPDHPDEGAIYQALDAANRAGVVIMDNTQVLHGTVNNNAYAAGAWLPAVGALGPLDMTPMASFAKLTVLLAAQTHNSWRLADVKRLMELSLLGEMADICRLDSRGKHTLLAGETLTAPDGSAMLGNDRTAGPKLTDSAGNILWIPLADPSPKDMPGRLVLTGDGNLVFYSRNNHPLWATDTGSSARPASRLVLNGAKSDAPLSLKLYDYSARMVIATLYEGSSLSSRPDL